MKLSPNDSTMDLMLKMSEGNPGALMLCTELFKLGTPGVVALINLDDIGLYGDRLYMLWNDCCDRDADKVIKVIEAMNSGKFSAQDIRDRVSGGWGKAYTDEELEMDDSNDSNDSNDGEESK